jgi:hypothetical protein
MSWPQKPFGSLAAGHVTPIAILDLVALRLTARGITFRERKPNGHGPQLDERAGKSTHKQSRRSALRTTIHSELRFQTLLANHAIHSGYSECRFVECKLTQSQSGPMMTFQLAKGAGCLSSAQLSDFSGSGNL